MRYAAPVGLLLVAFAVALDKGWIDLGRAICLGVAMVSLTWLIAVIRPVESDR